MKIQETYHDAVMLKESTEALNIHKDGIYVDVTFGGGGHSREILRHLDKGHLYAFDQDSDSETQSLSSNNFTFIGQNFRYVSNFLRMHHALPVDGLIADLGISSHQIDTTERGFSFRSDGPLDMRMSKSSELSAEIVVNDYSPEQLTEILKSFGEMRNARAVVNRIVRERQLRRLKTTSELVRCVENLFPPHQKNKGLAKIFQAIRIEVNGELNALKDLLLQCNNIIRENGRIVFITYHSLEDRLVKNFIRSGDFTGEVRKDFFGNAIRPFEAINRKALVPDEKEIAKNNRARSAKLRAAKKLHPIGQRD